MEGDKLAPDDPSSAPRRSFVVAIPVKDEEERLPACLHALAKQEDCLGKPIAPGSIRLVAFINNSSDGSAALIRSLGTSLGMDILVIEATLPLEDAHAGTARGAAMDLAYAWLSEHGPAEGIILTTDADSRVPRDWIARNLAAFDAHADAVLGRVALDEDGARLPEPLHRRGRLEDAYERLLTELSNLLDPVDWNPWPHHSTISGASLAVTAAAYRAIGGLPRVPCGEDKALVAALLREDARLRFAPGILVVTSARTSGRAPGGVADALRLRSENPDALCDEALEPARVAMKRALWRGRMRRLHRRGRLATDERWRRRLQVSSDSARGIVEAARFGAAWRLTEEAAPCLARRLLVPADLPEEIEAVRRAIVRIRSQSLAARKDIDTERITSVAADDLQGWIDDLNEALGGLVPA